MKFRKLNANEIECRVQSVKSNGAVLLLYKDARCDMGILDSELGMEYWQREHREVKGNIYCGVSLYLNLGSTENPDNQWVTKWDAGAESYTEKVKGEASDSFKRACFNWGIGRELYTSPFIWIKPVNGDIVEKNSKHNFKWGTKFNVAEVDYINDAISYLVIIDQNGTVRYKFGTKVANLETLEELIDLKIKDSDMDKWLVHYGVEFKNTLDGIRQLSQEQSQFIIDRFKKKDVE